MAEGGDRPHACYHPRTETEFVMSAPNEAVTKDIEKARSTYERFMGTLKWAIPIIMVIVFIVVTLLAS